MITDFNDWLTRAEYALNSAEQTSRLPNPVSLQIEEHTVCYSFCVFHTNILGVPRWCEHGTRNMYRCTFQGDKIAVLLRKERCNSN